MLTDYFVSSWIAGAFLLLIPLPFVLLVRFVKRETEQTPFKWAYSLVFSFFVLYLAYIGLASYQGWFNQILFPPKVLLLTTFPFAFLLFMVVGKTRVYNAILATSMLEDWVKLHIFRLIGVFFILLAFQDALPKHFALIAGLGDMLTAVSSIFVARAIRHKKSYAKKLTYYWNIFGTVDILFTAIAANVLTKLSIDQGTMGVDSLAFFPFCIIPAFAPPVILFLHWSIFKKLKTFPE